MKVCAQESDEASSAFAIRASTDFRRLAWRDNLVLLVRDQSLSDADLIAFSRRFGDLDLALIQETGRRFVEGLLELYVVSNVVEGGVPIGSLGNDEAAWPTAMSYVDGLDLQTPKNCSTNSGAISMATGSDGAMNGAGVT